jgi:hypothetical protein
MRAYRYPGWASVSEFCCPSTKFGHVVNASPDGIPMAVALGSSLSIPVGLGMVFGSSAWGVIIPGILLLLITLFACSYLISWVVNSHKLNSRQFDKGRLQHIEDAYALMPKVRRNQYGHLVDVAYKNASIGRSNSKILELFEMYVDNDPLSTNKFVDNELEIAKQVKQALEA